MKREQTPEEEARTCADIIPDILVCCHNVFRKFKYTIQRFDGREGAMRCYRRVNTVAYFRNDKQKLTINFRSLAKEKVNIGDILTIE